MNLCQISKKFFFFLDLLVHKLFFYKNHSLQLLSTRNNWSISLLLISIILHTVGKETNYRLRWKLYCYSSPSNLTREIFFCLLSAFFAFLFWPIEITTANLQGLTHSNLSRSTNQVTLSNEHMNDFFWVQGDMIHYSTIPNRCLFSFVFILLTKRRKRSVW